MRLFLLVCLVMIAFASNSVLNRLALVDAGMGPASFAAIRMLSGALALAALVAMRTRPANWSLRPAGAASLLIYIIGFSFAYVTLDAGVGALILFGGVQVTMFAGALIAREQISPQRWAGAAIAFAGLIYLMWPGGTAAPALSGVALMTLGALGWGLYSLVGRGASDPLQDTAMNFIYATPPVLAIALVLQDTINWPGTVLAIVAGALTSGLGYALWYLVLPRIASTTAALAQLTVPIIALSGGILFLSEELTLRFALATALVLGGIGLSLIRR
ncbi:DMT family transporter [Cognatishimia sp. MH4019]|uniref:DMT family transporter n=1 Tax=Cognatishimia sp. MH4019 TaxID=2854030 RepID=UPI001CD55286|nr:DMT family transporter [Cognatishimia sp. MH4019]